MANTEKEIAERAKKYNAMEKAMAQLFVAWAAAESELANLLAIAVQPNFHSAVWAIFFAPSGIDARLKLVDAALEDLFSNAPKSAHIWSQWVTINNALGRLKNIRNAVAHGTIAQVASMRGNYYTITPPAYDLKRLKKPKQRGQKFGVTENDIKDSTQAVWHQRAAIAALGEDISAIWKAGPSGPSPQKPAELAADHQPYAPLKGGRNPQGRKRPPRPSRT